VESTIEAPMMISLRIEQRSSLGGRRGVYPRDEFVGSHQNPCIASDALGDKDTGRVAASHSSMTFVEKYQKAAISVTDDTTNNEGHVSIMRWRCKCRL
jgi:hypothetical protein